MPGEVILGGDFEVYYLAQNRQKRIVWTGGTNAPRTVRELYSAMANLLDETTQMDDGSALSAQTPTEYTIGIIDPSDKDPWFIDRTSVEHLTGGALKTASWKRTASNVGIIKITCNNTSIVTGDIGFDIVSSYGDTGTLLDIKGTTGVGVILWIRPDSFASANDFSHTDGTLTCNTHTAVQSTVPILGDSLWANIYSLGTIETYTHLYVYQNAVKLAAYKGTIDWWTDGHFDVLVCVKECDPGDGTGLIDQGYVTVLGRQCSKAYDSYIVLLSSGGRNPIPLATADDSNNPTGNRSFVGTGGSGTFNVGNYIYVGSTWATATKRGVLTAVASYTLTYYLLGDLTDFVNSDSVKEWTGLIDGDGTCTVPATVSDAGPASYTNITIAHGKDETLDIDENEVHENYSIVVTCANRTVVQIYERLKYITRRGGATTGDTDGIKGEAYLGTDYRILYVTLTGSIAEGVVVTQYSGGFEGTFIATGTVVAHNTTDKILVLRNSRGSFDSTNTIYLDANNRVATPTSTSIAPVKAAPFGTFAGGSFYCAPGIALSGVNGDDLNKFFLIDDNGNPVQSPTKVTVAVTNTKTGDKIAVFRLTAALGSIKKDEYTVDTAQGAAGSTILKVDPAIGSATGGDTPGKTLGGIVRVVDISEGVERRYRYTGWTGDEFTLFNMTASTATSGGAIDILVDSVANFVTGGVKVGDIIRNVTHATEICYVTEVTDLHTLHTTPLSAGVWDADNYRIGVTVESYATSDTVYVPFIDSYETADGSETASVTYVAPAKPVLVRVRQAGEILPFEIESEIGSLGMSVSTVRTPDTIYE